MARVTEKKPIDIDHTCVQNPVYLNWLNTKGGRDYWLFRNNQIRSKVTTVNASYEPYLRDIENAQGYLQDIEKSSTPRLTIGAFVPVSKLQGIEGMLGSINVLMLMNPYTWETDGPGSTPKPIWQIVRPLPSTYRLNETDENFANIEVTLELPFINLQAQ